MSLAIVEDGATLAIRVAQAPRLDEGRGGWPFRKVGLVALNSSWTIRRAVSLGVATLSLTLAEMIQAPFHRPCCVIVEYVDIQACVAGYESTLWSGAVR